MIIANSALAPHWLSIILYPMRAHGIIVKYNNVTTPYYPFFSVTSHLQEELTITGG